VAGRLAGVVTGVVVPGVVVPGVFPGVVVPGVVVPGATGVVPGRADVAGSPVRGLIVAGTVVPVVGLMVDARPVVGSVKITPPVLGSTTGWPLAPRIGSPGGVGLTGVVVPVV
jgi:hypothetical protein